MFLNEEDLEVADLIEFDGCLQKTEYSNKNEAFQNLVKKLPDTDPFFFKNIDLEPQQLREPLKSVLDAFGTI